MILAFGLRPTRKRLPIFPPSDARGRWSRVDQSSRGGSPEIARLLAWIDAVASHEDPAQVLAAIESADLREQERLEGRYTQAAKLLAEQASPELRAAFAREDCIEVILGWWDVDLGWHVGLAELTYMECQVTTLALNELTPREIADHEDVLSRKRRRAGETMPLEEVYKYMSTSARKLQTLFRAPPVEELPTPRKPEPPGVRGIAGASERGHLQRKRLQNRSWRGVEDEENSEGEPWLDDRG